MNAKIREVMALALEVPDAQITEDCSAEGISSWDSIHHLNLVMALEEAFGVSFPTGEFAGLQSYRAIAASLAERGVV